MKNKKEIRRRYRVFSTNCDCASGTIVRQKSSPRWVLGPKCPYCGRQLGWMQFAFMDEVSAISPFAAEDEYERRLKAGITVFQVNQALESPQVIKKGCIMEAGNWVQVKGGPTRLEGLPFMAYGKIISVDETNAEVKFPFETREVNKECLNVVDNHQCSPENVGRFLEWLKNRGGIAVWNSVNLSNPAMTWSSPVNDEEGKPFNKKRVSWQAGEVVRIVTDINDVDVVVSKEVKRFHVAVRKGSNGMSLKVTHGGTRRIEAAKRKAAEKYGDAWHEFDFGDYHNAVICVPDKKTPLSEWEVNDGPTLQLGTMPHEVVGQC